MSYAQRQQFGSNRNVAIIIVAIIHAVLGYAIVSGLAYNVIQNTTDNLKTFDVVEKPPPPPEEPPPPPPEEPVPETPPQVVAPPPIVQTKVAPPPPVQTVTEAPPPVVTTTANPAPVGPPARLAPPPPPPPPPPPVKTVPPRSAVGNLQGLFTGSDYPEPALEREEQGSVTVRLTIATNGRVSGCNVTSSSGSRALDRATCRVLQSRAKFTPARDSRGNPTTDTVSQSIRWVLEG